jgi:4-carboxymuconolactone decarboxylase
MSELPPDGVPPDRLPPVDENDPEIAAAFAELAVSRGRISNALRSMAHAPQALLRFAAVGDYARYRSSLSPRLREIVIVITGRKVPYAMSHHVPLALQAGLTQQEVDELREGRVPRGFQGKDAAVAGYVLEFLSAQSVSDAAFEAARRCLTPREITDVSMTSAYYVALAMIITAMGVTFDSEDRMKAELEWQQRQDRDS